MVSCMVLKVNSEQSFERKEKYTRNEFKNTNIWHHKAYHKNFINKHQTQELEVPLSDVLLIFRYFNRL